MIHIDEHAHEVRAELRAPLWHAPSITASKSVFQQVLGSWAFLGASLAPIALLMLGGRRMGPTAAVATVVSGAATSLLARFVWNHELVYEAMPGIIVGLGVGWLGSRVDRLESWQL